MFGVRKAPTGCNFVHNDEIWKDHVRRELQTSRKWPDTWGFLTTHYQGTKDKSSHSIYRHLQSPRSQRPQTAASSLKLPPIQQKHSHGRRISSLQEALSQALKGPGPSYPKTTAGEVGWRWAEFGKLEKYGRHARGQQGFRKQLNWPREGIL